MLTAPRNGRRIEIAVVVAVTSVIGIAYVALSFVGIDLVDEGYFLDLASRVQHGQLPYRDFDTYYTPGIFYLNAALLSGFGANVIPARLAMAAFRLSCALTAYFLARRLSGPPFAAIPALLIAATGLLVGSHPGWPALLATLLMLAALVRAYETRARSWLVVAGGAAALAFAFKQNVGAFALIGVAGYALLVPARDVGPLLLATRGVFAAALAIVMRVFLSPLLDPFLEAAVWLPLAASLIVLTAWSRPVWKRPLAGLDSLAEDGFALAAGAALVTAAWLVPLMAALGIPNTPFSLFLGNVNQGALVFQLDGPPRGSFSLALVAVWTPLGIAFTCRPGVRTHLVPAAVALAITLLILQMPTRDLPLDPLAVRADLFPRLAALDLELGSLVLYLPALCAWAAILLVATRRYRAQIAPPVAWFVFVGALAQLALFPRADTPHGVLAGAPLLVAGAWVLGTVHARLSRGTPRIGKMAIFCALLIVPVATVGPHLYRLSVGLRHPDPTLAVAVTYTLLQHDRARVLLPRSQADPLLQALTFLQDRTPADEPLFAYPMDPLVNFLTDRPNPTRFDHFIPGALSPGDMWGVVDDLERTRPRYVLWDHAAVVFWETDHPNRILSDYIWRCYRQVATFRLYLVLERTAC